MALTMLSAEWFPTSSESIPDHAALTHRIFWAEMAFHPLLKANWLRARNLHDVLYRLHIDLLWVVWTDAGAPNF